MNNQSEDKIVEDKLKRNSVELPKVPVFGAADFSGSDKTEGKTGSRQEETEQESRHKQEEVVFLNSNDSEYSSGEISENSANDKSSDDEVVFLSQVEEDGSVDQKVSKDSEEAALLEHTTNGEGSGLPDVLTIALDNKIVISNIENLVKMLDFDINTIDKVTIDAANVDYIDTAGLQVIVGFANKLKKLKKELEWVGVSEEFEGFATVLALDTYLDFTSITTDAVIESEFGNSNQEQDLCPVF